MFHFQYFIIFLKSIFVSQYFTRDKGTAPEIKKKQNKKKPQKTKHDIMRLSDVIV